MQIIPTTGIHPIEPFKQDSYCENCLKQFNTLLNRERVVGCGIYGHFTRSDWSGCVKGSSHE